MKKKKRILRKLVMGFCLILLSASVFHVSGDPIDGNIVGYWAFDQLNGSVTLDGSGNGNDGTVSGATITSGQIDNALDFDGVNDEVFLGNLNVAPSNGNNGITLAAWINPDVWVGSLRDDRIISKSTGISEQDHYWMLSPINSSGETRLRFRLKTGTSTKTLISSSGNIQLNTWTHVAATYDGSFMRVFINGSEVGSAAKTGTLATNLSVGATIGINPDGQRPFDGKIDEVYILDRALTAQELTDLMTRTSSGSDTEAPSVPTGLAAGTVTETSVGLSWNASTDNVGVTGYKVYTDGFNPVTVTSTSTTITGLAASTQYSFTVSAIDAADNESEQSLASQVTTATPPDTEAPGIPINLVSSNITTSSVDLSWDASTDNVGVTGYKVYTDGANPQNVTSTSVTISGLSASTQYSFTVSAIDAASNESAQSSAVQLTTQASQEINNLALNKPVTVDSEYNTTYVAEKAVDGNNVDNVNRWVSANSAYPHWIEIDLEETSSIEQVNFWIGYNGYNRTIYDYQVQYWTGFAWADIVNITGNNSAIVTHNFSTVETDKVRLYCTDGEDNIVRLYEIEVWGTVGSSGGGDTEAPSIPTGLITGTVTSNSVDLSWNASTDNVGVTGYKVYTDGSNPVTVTGTSTTINGLAASTQYSFTVSAIDAASNESAQSAAINATTQSDGSITEYYVDPATGNMSNNGSESSPWSSLEDVFNAGKTFQAGDVIYLLSGNHGNPVVTESNTANVTITKYGSDNPVINNIDFNGADYWTLKDVKISAGGAAFPNQNVPLEHPVYPLADNALVYINGGGNIILDNCEISSIDDNSVWTTVDDWNYKAWNGVMVGGNNVTIIGCNIKNVNFGCTGGGSDFIFRNNTIENFCGDGMQTGADYAKIEDNIFMNCYNTNGNHDDMFQFYAGSGNHYGVEIRGNKFINYTDANQPFRGEAQGMGLFDGMHINFIFENNLVVTSHWHGLTILGATNCKVVNNSVIEIDQVGAGPSWIQIAAAKDGTLSAGNIVSNNLCTDIANDANIGTVENNIVIPWSQYDTYFEDFANSNLHLSAASPAIDAGTSANAPSIDLDGISRPQGAGYDVGCYEYEGSSSGGDTEAPSIPTGLAVGTITSNSVDLSWNASTDNVGVTGYKVYTNSSNPISVTGTSTTITGLASSTQYSFTVSAIDAADNESAQSSAVNATTSSASGITSNATWQSFNVSTQTGVFTATFDATPNGSALDAITGILNGSAGAYGDIACIIRFYTNGQIDARNGSSYAADNVINYTSGVSYHFRVEISVPTHTYSVYVTPQGGSEQTVATNFAFRSEQASVTQLTGWTLFAASGSHTVSNMTFTPAAPDTEAPSVPTGLVSSNIYMTSFTLNWNASTDNVGVNVYEVFKDGVSYGTTTNTSMFIAGLSANTTYSMTVRAGDAVPNWSAQSSAINVTTSADAGGDWPTTSTTGTSGTLTPHSGNITTTSDGQLIENLDISGNIYVKNSNVTIRNCKFHSLDIQVTTPTLGENCVVEDCELTWAGRQNFTLRRCFMTNHSTDLIRTSAGNILIEDCYLYIYGPMIEGSHVDIIQEYPSFSGYNNVARHNTMYSEIPQTSVVNIRQGWRVENNLMAGGGYPFYSYNAEIVDNHLSTIMFPGVGNFGIYYGGNYGNTCSGNIIHETGEPADCSDGSSAEVEFTETIQQGIKMYPNPLNGDILNIQLNDYDINGDINVNIADLTGRIVYSQLHKAQSVLNISLGNLSKGIYIIFVNGNQQKLIVE